MSNIKLRPLFDKVLIEREKVEPKNGIILPDSIKDRHAPAKGTIVAIGPDVNTSDTDTILKEGDRVIFGSHAGSWLNKDQDDEIYICLDTDILCVVEDE